MNSLPESQEINELIVEFLKSMDMQHTIDAMEQEIKSTLAHQFRQVLRQKESEAGDH